MNYINISTPSIQNVNINANLDDIAATGLISWSLFADGSDTLIVAFDNSVGAAQVTAHGYYHRLGIDTAVLVGVKDETQYNLIGEFNGKVIYRGKIQTTAKDIDVTYTINEGKYTSSIDTNNFTILD